MKLKTIPTNNELEELYTHSDPTFPVTLDIDNYANLLDQTLNCHFHNNIELALVTDGTLDYYINGDHYKVTKDECVFINSNTLHLSKSRYSSEVNKSFIVLFSASFLSGDMSSSIYQKYFRPIVGRYLSSCIINRDTPTGNKIIDQMYKLRELDSHKFGYELLCMSELLLLWKLLAEYFATYTTEQNVNENYNDAEIAKMMLHYIHENYSEKLTIPQIAKEIHVSRGECYRCFKRFTKKTPVEYINEYRLIQAEKMLNDTKCSITEISTATGFCSCSYFTKLFKSTYGMTPHEYRRKFS